MLMEIILGEQKDQEMVRLTKTSFACTGKYTQG